MSRAETFGVQMFVFDGSAGEILGLFKLSQAPSSLCGEVLTGSLLALKVLAWDLQTMNSVNLSFSGFGNRRIFSFTWDLVEPFSLDVGNSSKKAHPNTSWLEPPYYVFFFTMTERSRRE